MAISCSFSWGSFPGSVGNVRVISWADGRAVFSPGVADVDSGIGRSRCVGGRRRYDGDLFLCEERDRGQQKQ